MKKHFQKSDYEVCQPHTTAVNTSYFTHEAMLRKLQCDACALDVMAKLRSEKRKGKIR